MEVIYAIPFIILSFCFGLMFSCKPSLIKLYKKLKLKALENEMDDLTMSIIMQGSRPWSSGQRDGHEGLDLKKEALTILDNRKLKLQKQYLQLLKDDECLQMIKL